MKQILYFLVISDNFFFLHKSGTENLRRAFNSLLFGDKVNCVEFIWINKYIIHFYQLFRFADLTDI